MLHKLKRDYDELVQQWTKDYIWQKEPFELKLYQPGVDPAMQKKGGKRVLLPTPLSTTPVHVLIIPLFLVPSVCSARAASSVGPHTVRR